MIRRAALLVSAALALFALALPAGAAAEECSLTPRTKCFGIESVEASLSTTEAGVSPEQAGAHPDLELNVGIKQDPTSEPNVFGLHDSYGTTRDIRFNTPPGLIGDPNVLGVPQQCKVQELVNFVTEGCPNGSQVGISTIYAYDLMKTVREPLYMMAPPGGDVVARLGTVAGLFPTFIDFRVRSEGDYGLVADVVDAPAAAKLIALETTIWGVPAGPSHDNERCTPEEALFGGCVPSPSRPPGSLPLPFLTNPTRCGVPLTMGVNASSWLEPELLKEKEVKAPFPTIVGCDRLPYGPSLTAEPTNHRAGAPTGLDMTLRAPASDGVEVLEPSQTRDLRIDLPQGMATNPGSADGLGTCSEEQVRFGKREDAHCPDAAKLAATEFDVAALPRRMKGAIYLREPEPGNPFRIWVVADDLGAHVKLEGQLDVDKESGQIRSVVLDAPQAPVREVRLLFKSGSRAPLLNPQRCGIYLTHYDLTPWSGGPDAVGDAPMAITEGCDTGGFSPKLSAGTLDPAAAEHSPFLFTLTRQDREENPLGLDLTLPSGLLATLAGVARCEGAAAQSGECPPDSRIGRAAAAIGAGVAPLWVPQAGKRPTAIYLSGPYRGAPLSIVARVPRQAGPFDFGEEVVRSAVFVDPSTGQATAKADPLPQIIEGVPVLYRAIHVILDRPGFSLNPTSCKAKETIASLTSTEGSLANASSPFRAANCASLPFKPALSFRLFGATHRGAHPKLKATLKMPPGGANIATTSVALPHSEFLDQGHIRTVCTRVQFAAKACPAGSIYGTAVAKTPLLDETLEGPVYLRSSSHELPDLVVALKGPASLPIEVELVGRVDSVNGGIRTSFEAVPDAPVSEFTLQMQGGARGLLQNSTELCAKANRATAKFSAQNGRVATLHPKMGASCKGHTKHKRG
jgi:hypothetical protein